MTGPFPLPGAQGGGIWTTYSYLTLENSTVTGNSASQGGGIYNDFSGPDVDLTNSLIAGNTATSGPDVDGWFAGTYNLIGNGTDMTGLTDGVGGNQVGTAASPINPRIDALANNGGPTETHALQETSPAVDAGTDCSGPPVGGVDQRGATRDAMCDIGSYEYSSNCAVLELKDSSVIGVETHSECEIRVGPNFTVAGSGDLTLTVGKRAVILNGFAVLTGGLVEVAFDPNLQLRSEPPGEP